MALKCVWQCVRCLPVTYAHCSRIYLHVKCLVKLPTATRMFYYAPHSLLHSTHPSTFASFLRTVDSFLRNFTFSSENCIWNLWCALHSMPFSISRYTAKMSICRRDRTSQRVFRLRQFKLFRNLTKLQKTGSFAPHRSWFDRQAGTRGEIDSKPLGAQHSS